MKSGPIIFLVTHSSAGGVQEVWADLAEGFEDAGYVVRLMALYPGEKIADTVPQNRWNHVRDQKPSTMLGAMRLFAELMRIFRKERPSMVFTAMPAANVIGPLAASLGRDGTRVCISHHSPVTTHQRLLNFLDGFTGSLRSTCSVIAVSNTVSLSLDGKPQAYQRKCRTIHNALPPRVEAKLHSLAGKRITKPGKRRRVVAIGRLAQEKNYPVLLRSAVHISDVEIVIAGSGPLEASLKDMANTLGVTSRVRFLGQISRNETLEVLASADVFTQPSIFEGHSLALLEAAKLGIPLVVSDVPAQIEGISRSDGSRCGIAVALHDDLALARELQRLMDDLTYYQKWANASRALGEEATYVRMLSSYRSLMPT